MMSYPVPLFLLLLFLLLPTIRSFSKSIAIGDGLSDVKIDVGQLFNYSISPLAFIGKVHTYQVSDAAGGSLPPWLIWDQTNRRITGVADVDDLGHVYVQVTAFGTPLNGTHALAATDVFDVDVREGNVQLSKCPSVNTLLTIDLHISVDLDTLSSSDRIALLQRAALLLDMDIDKFRLYSADYERQIRRPQVLMVGSGNGSSFVDAIGSSTILICPISCSSTMDAKSIEIVERLLKIPIQFGHILLGWNISISKPINRRQRRRNAFQTISSGMGAFFSTETPTDDDTTKMIATTSSVFTAASSRPEHQTTKRQADPRMEYPNRRRFGDEKPAVTNSMRTFTCLLGVICRIRIPSNTFLDAEDGDTENLHLSFQSMDESTRNWLFLDQKRQTIIGIPLALSTSSFRLQARDSVGQLASTAFLVKVIDQNLAFNHRFRLTVDRDLHDLLTHPETIVQLVRRLALSVSSDRNPSRITITAIENGSTVLEWSNNTLSREVCVKNAVKQLQKAMVTNKGRVKIDFRRHMGFQFSILSVRTIFLGNCVDSSNSSEKTSNERTELDISRQTADHLLILPFLLIAILILLAILLVVCYFYRRNRTDKLAGRREARSDFVSKGLPVVFPEELETNGDLMTVNTPMLVKEERPPLLLPSLDGQTGLVVTSEHRAVSVGSNTTTTAHDNPLYKPPPPIEMAAIRSSPLRHVISLQRDPPPYVPP